LTGFQNVSQRALEGLRYVFKIDSPVLDAFLNCTSRYETRAYGFAYRRWFRENY